MIILAIETSCDETAIAILKTPRLRSGRFEILSNVVSSQIKIHAKWGGVVPHLAKREHIKNLPLVLRKALREAKVSSINVIAVTAGPGLEPALWTGINFAKELAEKWKKTLIAINHMEAHIFSVFLKEKSSKFQVPSFKFPAVALLVSGGHTELVLMRKMLDYKIIGQTLDDAAGEAFDKTAKMLGLPYPGGPIVAKLAEEKVVAPFTLPRPMINSKNYDFSFSGLKTAVLYKLKELGFDNLKPHARLITRKQIAYEFQQAVIDVLVSKTLRTAKEYQVKTIILGGGVAANQELRKQLGEAIKKQIPNTKYLIPDTAFTGDNAAMIALAAYFRAKEKKILDKLGTSPENLKADGNLKLS